MTALWAVDGALGLSGGAGGVVHDGVVVARRGEGAEIVRGLVHQDVVVEVALGEGLGGASVLVDDDDVLEVRQLREDLRDLLPQFRLGDEHLSRRCSPCGRARGRGRRRRRAGR